MSYRCDLYVNSGHRKVVLVPSPEETLAHLALRLSGLVLFWEKEPRPELSAKHPALTGQEFKPDFVALEVSGEIALWGECGNVATHKLNKLVRRYPNAEIVILKESEPEGQRQRKVLNEEVAKSERIQIFAWPAEPFSEWRRGLSHDNVTVVGEATPGSLNLVINETPLAVTLRSF